MTAPSDGARFSQPVPGIYRLGDSVVNFYVIDHGDRLVLVDAGLPAHRGQLDGLLSQLGRRPSDISAVLITHAHPDHLGLAARLQAGVVVQVKKCTSNWCHVSGNGFDGWIEQQRLWGVYADERVE